MGEEEKKKGGRIRRGMMKGRCERKGERMKSQRKKSKEEKYESKSKHGRSTSTPPVVTSWGYLCTRDNSSGAGGHLPFSGRCDGERRSSQIGFLTDQFADHAVPFSVRRLRTIFSVGD